MADTATAEYPVTVTPKAVDMVNKTREQEEIESSCGLRIAVRGGGCSGFEYARYLAGTEIDYVLGMTGAGFKFNNPNAIGTCGCGSSFTV